MKLLQLQAGRNSDRLLLICVALLVANLAACGFYLAGATNLPPQLVSIHLLAEDLNAGQKALLKRRLKQAGAVLTDNQDNGAVRLEVAISVLPDRRLADTAGSGKVITRILRQLDYSLTSATGESMVDQKTILRQLVVESDSDNIVGFEYEKRSAVDSLDQELVGQLVFQLIHFQN